MSLSDSDLKALKARCLQAQTTGYTIGKADAFMEDLATELRQKPGKATTQGLLDLIAQVEAVRSGKGPALRAPEAVPALSEETVDESKPQSPEPAKTAPKKAKKPARK